MREVMLPWTGGGFGQLGRRRIPAAFAIVYTLALGLGSPFLVYFEKGEHTWT